MGRKRKHPAASQFEQPSVAAEEEPPQQAPAAEKDAPQDAPAVEENPPQDGPPALLALPEPQGNDGQQAMQSESLPDINQAPADPDPLSRGEVDEFIEHGFVTLRGAFSAEAAARARDALWARVGRDGIKPTEPATWTRRHGIAEVYTADAEPWGDVLTPRLRGAIDQLCGAGRTGRFGCGWWVVTFPGVAEEPWGVDGAWHVDGFGYRHFVDSREIGLLPVFLFNDLGPRDGGTLLMPGSHRHVARLLWDAGSRGIDGGRLSRLARADVDEARAVEVRGSAGDVCLVHPFVLHARSKNMGTRPGSASVRFMCHPAVPLRTPMRVRGGGEGGEVSHTPVEAAIVAARPSNEGADCDGRPVANDLESLESVMGFKGFGNKRPWRGVPRE